jgi:4-amino-4-deoxy-L-arabinose transferase-like glycosyltransferase
MVAASPGAASSTSTSVVPGQRARRHAVARVAALVLVLGLATAVRTIGLQALGFNSDEAVYAGQAAAIAGEPVLKDIFPVFRAHPLLFQFTLGVLYRLFGASDWIGRLASAGIGVTTVYVVYGVGTRLYGPRTGLLAALLLAVMPYHVIVTRQVLLDGPMVLFSTLSLLFTASYGAAARPVWLYAAAAAMGLTFLAKETGILMAGSIYAFLALSPKVHVRILDIVGSLAVLMSVMAAFPLTIALAGGGGGGTTQQYLVWQLFRRPNHTWDFYVSVVPQAIGPLVIAAAVLGVWLLRHRNGWRERLLIVWVIVPVVFFQLWPTKGFQYLLPIAPPLALLAARTLLHWPERGLRLHRWRLPPSLPGTAAAVVVVLTLLLPSLAATRPVRSDSLLAGAGGIPGGREVGRWVNAHVPDGATLLTIGPSMANIIKFYGHRTALGISVSPNPLHRNPSYEPVVNPDYQIRIGEVQYLVWDSFSASRSHVFSEKILHYVQKYNGRAIHTETLPVTTPGGAVVEKPVIIVYEVRP